MHYGHLHVTWICTESQRFPKVLWFIPLSKPFDLEALCSHEFSLLCAEKPSEVKSLRIIKRVEARVTESCLVFKVYSFWMVHELSPTTNRMK